MWRFGVLVPVFAAGLMMVSETVLADNWSDRGPVFESDQRQREEQEAAERAANRKTYEPVVYPK
ncbi:MAG: L,D-transpeptidase, partial [Hyphomicrobium sp.]